MGLHPSQICTLYRETLHIHIASECHTMAQKIHEWINYQPILFLNVSIHPIEHIKVKHTLFESLFLRDRSLKFDEGVNLFRKISGS